MNWTVSLPNGYEISTDPDRFDLEAITDFLSGTAYWAKGRPAEVIAKSLKNSLAFGLYAPDGSQVGLTKVVGDGATFGWVCDVYVLDEHRGNGLGKALMSAVLSHEDVAPIKRLLLATADAHGLYEQYGFKVMDNPSQWMARMLDQLA